MMQLKIKFWVISNLLLLFIVGCSHSPKNLLVDDIQINLSKDSSQILIQGIDPFIIKEIEVDSLSEKDWQNMLAVYLKVEEDLQDLQSPVNGFYSIRDNNIIFKPAKSFTKGKEYLLEIYIQHPNSDITEKLKSDQELFNQNHIRKQFSF